MEVFFHLISSFLPFLRQGIATQPQLTWNCSVNPDLPQTKRFTNLFLGY